ncbi:MAG: succinate dehydrogenase, hydrophobic membrane anchor protein [Rhodothalassiaceae bacterium]
MRTPLAKVRGLGSAKEGTGHWWTQRVTAILNLVLLTWLVASFVVLAGTDYAGAKAWLQHPVAAALMVLAVGNLFYHVRTGLQVAIEDYIHKEGTKVVLLALLTLVCLLLAAIGIIAVLSIAFGS